LGSHVTKITLPDYVIEPPDVLLIDAVRVVPRPPYRISSLDVLSIHVEGALPERPLTGQIQVEPGGTINLGPPYGTINVNGMTLEQATAAITRQLQVTLREPVVTLLLEQTTGKQQIAGEHLVGPDGTVTLGTYGKVYVAGLTQGQAKAAIELHLSSVLERPEVAVDIAGYNSKVYYVIMQGAGLGDGVARFPITGNETVLDAISQVNGLEAVSSKHLWVARPSPYGACDQVLPVDWNAITQRADTATNYQLLPGDRLFIRKDSTGSQFRQPGCEKQWHPVSTCRHAARATTTKHLARKVGLCTPTKNVPLMRQPNYPEKGEPITRRSMGSDCREGRHARWSS
jgi:polysaccharide export outer membrane protein